MFPVSHDPYVKNYLRDNSLLIRTMCIKSEATARALNNYLVAGFGSESVDLSQPSTWKYYLNVSGQYHEKDTPMMVTSLDTMDEIIFSKENLVIHRETAKAYGFGSRYYYSLVNRYPEQEQLILGVLYPCDIDVAIEAEDFTILSYPPSLVESQEETLIADLQAHINRYVFRNMNANYELSDPLYHASWLSIFYQDLLLKVLNLRLQRCQTNEVHSFHLREYLRSHQRLDMYLPYLNLRQSLYLYRNIRYLEANPGKRDTFDEIVEKILTQRYIPLAEFSVRHLDTFDENLLPSVTVRRRAVNNTVNSTASMYLSYDELVEKEQATAGGNPKYYLGSKGKVYNKLQLSRSSAIQTKNLESDMVDYSDSVPDKLPGVLLNHWIFMACEGLYQSVISVVNPQTNLPLQLTVKDALIYYVYLSMRLRGQNVQNVPGVVAERHRTLSKPTKADLLKHFPPSDYLSAMADTIVDHQPDLAPIYSTDAFFEFAYAQYKEMERYWIVDTNTFDAMERARVEVMCDRVYADTTYFPDVEPIPMQAWLFDRNLPEYHAASAPALIQELFMKSTGFSQDETKQLRNIQKRLLDLFAQLSSYSIQVIRDINVNAIIPALNPFPRIEHMRASSHGRVAIEARLRLESAKIISKTRVGLDLSDCRDLKNVAAHSLSRVTMDISLGFTTKVSSVGRFIMDQTTQHLS